MTKVTTLEASLQGNQQEQPKKKQIELVKFLCQVDGELTEAFLSIDWFDEVALISKRKSDENYDVILAKVGNSTSVYLGHWNDEVVE